MVETENCLGIESEHEFYAKQEVNFGLTHDLSACIDTAELQCGLKDCCSFEWEPPKIQKYSKNVFLTAFLHREILIASFFASLRPTFCELDTTENVAPKQLQLSEIC